MLGGVRPFYNDEDEINHATKTGPCLVAAAPYVCISWMHRASVAAHQRLRIAVFVAIPFALTQVFLNAIDLQAEGLDDRLKDVLPTGPCFHK